MIGTNFKKSARDKDQEIEIETNPGASHQMEGLENRRLHLGEFRYTHASCFEFLEGKQF